MRIQAGNRSTRVNDMMIASARGAGNIKNRPWQKFVKSLEQASQPEVAQQDQSEQFVKAMQLGQVF